MKVQKFLACMAVASLFGGVFASCSDDATTDEQDATILDFKPAKSADFRIYSGGTMLTNSFVKRMGSRADVSVNGNYFKIQDFGGGKSDWMQSSYPVLYQYFDNAPAQTDRQEQVSQAEYDCVMAYLSEHPDEGGLTCDLTTYFIQNVGSSYASYHLGFMNGDDVHHYTDITGGNQMDYLQFGDLHINDYNAHWGPRALCVDIPVVSPSYHDSYGTEEQTKQSAYRFYYIEYDGRTACYLCFDYQTKKYDNGQLDYHGDGIFNDWVIKLIPADGSDAQAPAGGDDPVEEPTIPQAGEVEVNLSVNAEKVEDDYIATKLSLHVRDTTDVEVFIPVPADLYCDADDMDIVLSHRLEVEMHSPYSTIATYDVDGNTVTATVTYEVGGIRVRTSGINAAVLRYLRQTYADGLTVEVWNYYKDTTTRDALKPLLDAATVTFTAPVSRYVNAFARLDGAQNLWDCTVAPPAAYGEGVKADGTQNYNVTYTR